MTTHELREQVCALAWRLPVLGIGPDIAALSFIELWGVYAFLTRLADGG